MSPRLPEPHEARQLCRLRGLRVQRAREGVARAQEQVDLAQQAVWLRRQQVHPRQHCRHRHRAHQPFG